MWFEGLMFIVNKWSREHVLQETFMGVDMGKKWASFKKKVKTVNAL